MRIFLKTWVAIIMAAFTAITGGLSVAPMLSKAHWPLSLIALISFVIFAIIVIAGIFDKDRQIKQLKNAPLVEKLRDFHDKLHSLANQFCNEIRTPDLEGLYWLTSKSGTRFPYKYGDIESMICDGGTVVLSVERDSYVWNCLKQHIRAEFPKFDVQLADWRNGIVSIIDCCNSISKAIADELSQKGFEVAEPYLAQDAKDYGPGIYHQLLTSSLYGCAIYNYEPQFSRRNTIHGLISLLIIEHPKGTWEIARGDDKLVQQIEKFCRDVLANSAIKQKATELNSLIKDTENKENRLRDELRPIQERGLSQGTCDICSPLSR